LNERSSLADSELCLDLWGIYWKVFSTLTWTRPQQARSIASKQGKSILEMLSSDGL
jgi:hypothetical protein